ncbi:hypothetical protein PFFVO_01236 [Plasmodium falciparum Vietnam Oak-Knoll (FVO)]|uniref:Surface antigen n=1 Tax=Plasmodium falciparum Vietnam Oak-Knoll (FVO) TaxID=1036723 RepID=A0A024VBM9_PLAFA|nr:hypothetical protein PFFVO_01236 [Plasmodium falciparum Vietnam Oak-Knoll (FVO)]
MKLHYSKILLFSLSLNIFVASSSGENNKNKPYITSHTPTTTSRVLSECDLYMSSYVNDPDMKSVKENFDRQTSQRFEQYEERINVKRQKCKEQCDRDIQKIIVKEKVQKSLAEKVEKVCLMCGCGLGGVASSVGIFGALTVNELKKAALVAATEEAMVEGAVSGTKTGIDYGINYIITELKGQLSIKFINSSPVEQVITVEMLNNPTLLIESVKNQYNVLCVKGSYSLQETICSAAGENTSQAMSFIDTCIDTIVGDAKRAADALTIQVTAENIMKLKDAKTAAVEASFVTHNTAIIASVVAILIIVLVMIIIYFFLRYRRKKKMKKKVQYMKLLKQ